MRRKDREITARNELIDILKKADVCRIAINDSPAPYIVPLNFGYRWDDNLVLFFHCAPGGRKLELLAVNDSVCFEIDTDHELVKGEKPCDWGMKYKSIIGSGKITEVIDKNEKIAALDAIMNHFGLTDAKKEYDESVFSKTKILRLVVSEISGKQRK